MCSKYKVAKIIIAIHPLSDWHNNNMYTIYVTGEKHNSLGKGVTANKKRNTSTKP